MALGKQAKILSKGQQEAILAYLTGTRYSARNKVSLEAVVLSDGREDRKTALCCVSCEARNDEILRA